MKYMKEMGMKISIDDVGNICGTLSGKYENDKSLVLGSHTDSVTNGGQFDGPVGVYMAMQAIDYFRLSNQEQYGNLKAIIYACEESTRFKTACLGSYYLSGKLSYEKISKLTDEKGITFNEAIAEYKDYIFSHLPEYNLNISDINLVEKVISQEEVYEAVEAHIEQAETLIESGYYIGGVDSIVKPLRGNISINGKNSIVTSAQIIKDLNSLANETTQNNEAEIYRITVPKFNSLTSSEKTKKITAENNNLIRIKAHGESNHSGATPMNARKDSVLWLANLILKLNEFNEKSDCNKIEFLGTSTPNWGANQIQKESDLILRLSPPTLVELIEEYFPEIERETFVSFEIENINEAEIQKNSFSELFVDVRQQYPSTGSATRDKLYNLLKKIQHSSNYGEDSIAFNITTIDTPVQTNTELLENIKKICFEKKYPCQIMHSWAGHDLACVLNPDVSNGKKILFFIPSEGGSHNPSETTTRESIETGTDVYYTLVSQRIEKLKETYFKNLSKSKSEIEER